MTRRTVVLLALLAWCALPPAQAQTIRHVTPAGEVVFLNARADTDEDGIENGLELDGYRFDERSGLMVACDPLQDTPCFQTDPRDFSTDGDPYSDFMEVSGVNMPSDVPRPYTHPLVAARPAIVVSLEGLTVTPITTITSSRGGEQSSSFSNSFTQTAEVGGSIGSAASLNPAELFKVESQVSFSESQSYTESTTSTFGTNWSTTRATDPSRAAEVRLRVRIRNIGSGTVLNLRPTVNLVLGDASIATFTFGEDDLVTELAPGGQYPASGPAVTVDRDSDNNPIVLTLRELQAVQAGAPLTLVVTQIDANVKRWNVQTEGFDSEISWASFESETRASSVTIKLQTGEGDSQEFQVFTGSQFFDPGYTLRDALRLVADVTGTGSETRINGRRYPDDWYAATSSDALVDRWQQAGRPASLLDLDMTPDTRLFLLSPDADPGPVVHLASFAPGMRQIYALAEPTGGFPILSAEATVQEGGQARTLRLEQRDGAFYVNPDELADAAEPVEGTRYGTVTFTDARGDSRTADLFPSLNTSCLDVREFEPLLPSPGGEFLLFRRGDPALPVPAYCAFFGADETLLDVPLESYWFPVESGLNPTLPGGGRIESVAFGSPQVGVAAAGIVLHTADGGETWAGAEHAGDVTAINAVAYSTPETAWSAGFFRRIGRSLDGGASWQVVQEENCCIFYGLAFADPTNGVAVGSSLGALYRTTNAGASWTEQALGATLMDDPRQVAFAGPDRGIVVGFDRGADRVDLGAMIRTDDAGATWSRVALDLPGPLTAAAFADGPRGLAAGWSGRGLERRAYLLRTEDAGASWTPVTLPDSVSTIWGIAFADDSTAYAVGDQLDASSQPKRGVILRSGDGGRTWEDQYSRTDRRLLSVASADPNVAVVVGEGGVILRNTSRGGDPAVVTSAPSEAAQPAGAAMLSLLPNRPNPFREATEIRFQLVAAGPARLDVYDALGRRISRLHDGLLQAGEHVIRFEARGLPAGLYFVRLTGSDAQAVRSILLVR
jgi:photosystem II stability/assembly factor-like uncharacterized protein